jgi:hypothetical protein
MTADTQDLITRAIKLLTDDEAQQLLDYIAFLQWQRKRAMPTGARYDFRDLAAHFTWEGDAVAVQQRLRHEW